MKLVKTLVLSILFLGAVVAHADRVELPGGNDTPGLSIVWLTDGHMQFGGLAIHAVSLSPTLSLNVVTASDFATGENSWTGSLLSFKVAESGGAAFSLTAGWKGFDWRGGLQHGERSWVFGAQLTVVIR